MAEKRTYTQQDIVNQSLVAFGQGTQFMRVNTRACRTLAEHMKNTSESRDLPARWETIAVQMLERVRLIGRVAATRAIEHARTWVDKEDVTIAIRRVSEISKTTECAAQKSPGEPGHP